MKIQKKECVAMLLAGGQGSRLGILTQRNAKPAVRFGGKYRVIDFPLSNCRHSGIDTVGVLTQFRPLTLNAYIGNGQPWDLDRMSGGVTILPPYLDGGGADFYHGTADAIYRNLAFLDQYDPDEVLILSGDHVYLMDYAGMIEFHRSSGADCTIASIEVPIKEASRFGILSCDADGRITDFTEKPAQPSSNLASMGISVFKYSVLRKELQISAANEEWGGDFGKDVIPKMLNEGFRMYTYRYSGYFRDVGTPQAFFDANMDLIGNAPLLNLHSRPGRVCSRTTPLPPHRIGKNASVRNSILTEGCDIDGLVEKSVLSSSVRIEKGAVVKNCVLMEGVTVGQDSYLDGCIVDADVRIGRGCRIGMAGGDLTLVGAGTVLSDQSMVDAGSLVLPEDTV